MNLITLENICKSYSEKQLLKDIKLTITEKDKIGVIGINGTGKSTLLKIISGIEVPDSGNIVKMNGLRIGYLPQDITFEPKDTILDHVFKGDSEVIRTLNSYEKVLGELKINSSDEILQNKLIKLSNELDALDGWKIESEAKALLTKLKIEDFYQPMGELSGGQVKRVGLCNALINPCDLLILDEPTNHMDNELIDYMEEILKGKSMAIIMITHDRYFLDRITNKIIEIYEGDTYTYTGNYSTFLEKKLERLDMMQSLERKRENLYRNELKWIRRGAQARSTKQKARIQRFNELQDTSYKVNEEKVDINTTSSRLGKKIIELYNINKSYGSKELIKGFSYIFTREDRVGIIGNNGVGKSTLLNIIAGLIKPDKGEVVIGDTVKIGYFTQGNQELDEELRVIEHIRNKAEYIATSDGEKITASQMLENFLFSGSMQHSKISKLSGGEKRRLYLLSILMEAPNVLFLDEPTNDLDIETLTILEDYLDRFNGTIVTISHDRYFLDRMANKIFSFEGNGVIGTLVGNYSDYKGAKESEEEGKIEEKSKKEKEDKKDNKKNKTLKFSYKEQKEFEEIDSKIEEKENEILEIEESINSAGSDFVLLQELLKKQKTFNEELEYLMERWTYLNELNELIETNRNKQ